MLHRVNQNGLADCLLRYVEWWEQLQEPPREGCLAPGALRWGCFWTMR